MTRKARARWSGWLDRDDLQNDNPRTGTQCPVLPPARGYEARLVHVSGFRLRFLLVLCLGRSGSGSRSLHALGRPLNRVRGPPLVAVCWVLRCRFTVLRLQSPWLLLFPLLSVCFPRFPPTPPPLPNKAWLTVGGMLAFWTRGFSLAARPLGTEGYALAS